MHIRNYTCFTHHYACVVQNIYMLEIYAYQKKYIEIYTWHKHIHLFSEIYDS